MLSNEPGFEQSDHVRLTPNERCHLDDGIISLGWNAGLFTSNTLALREFLIRQSKPSSQ